MLKIITRCFSLFFLLLIFYTFSASHVYAFEDSFEGNSLNSTFWEKYENNGIVLVSNSKVSLSTQGQTNHFPYVRSYPNTFSDTKPYEITIQYQYSSAGNFGTGLGIASENPNNKTTLSSNFRKYLLFVIWQDTSGLSIHTSTCPLSNENCSHTLIPIWSTNGVNLAKHEVKIEYNSNQQYQVYIDNQTEPTYTSSFSQDKSTGIWFGSPEQTNTIDYWSSINIESINITEEDKPITPIILIPGFGASWNYEAILKNQSSSDWQVPTWVTNYDNLLLSLEKAGYEKDKNLFVFTYDWRKPLIDLADDFDHYMNDLVTKGKLEPTDKVDLIGHSMGGLVARSYVQKIGPDKVNKIITAGTPHEGTLQSYSAWEGGQVRDFEWYQQMILNILLLANKKPTESKTDELRRIVPSIRDFLPTFDYLFENGKYVPYTLLKQQNETLQFMNDNLLVIKPLLESIYGTDHETLTRINITRPNWLDVVLDCWEDGKPTEYLNTYQGDGVVLSSSALSHFYQLASLPVNHGGTISSLEAIDSIFDSLKLDKSNIVTDSEQQVNEVLVALLRSPGQISIVNSQGLSTGTVVNNKLVFLPNPEQDNYQIKLSSNGESGKYTVSIGLLTQTTDSWKHFNGYLNNGQIKVYPVILSDNQIIVDSQKVDYEDVTKEYLGIIGDLSANNLFKSIQNGRPAQIKLPYLLNLKIRLHDIYKLTIKTNQPEKAEQIKALLPLLDEWIAKLESDTKTNSHLVTGGQTNPVNALKSVCETRVKASDSVVKAEIYEIAQDLLQKSTRDLKVSISKIWLDSAFLWFKDCVEL